MSVRLNDDDFEMLVATAKRVGIGHATLARRILESWLGEHAPRSRRK